MVKPLQSKYFKLLLVLITGIFVYVLIQFVCDHDNLPWQLDFKYSLYLTVDDSGYEHMTESKSSDTVDALRIYKVRSKRYGWYELGELFKKELVFETKDRRYVREFVLAAQKRMEVGDWEDSVMDTEEASEGCGWAYYKEREFDWFYVVMFDNTFMRAGYFAALVCKSRDKEYINVLVPDTSGFGPVSYYNEFLVPVFRALQRQAG